MRALKRRVCCAPVGGRAERRGEHWHARVEEAGLLRTAHVCVPEPAHLGEGELDHAGVVPACMQAVAISRNQGCSSDREVLSHGRVQGALRRSELPRGASWVIKGDRTWEVAPSRVQGALRRSELPRGALR